MAEIRWREWGDEAFAEARAAEKPILLDIGAVWCHWCHVMDHGIPGDLVHTGTYSNPEIAAKINRDYVPIKVDNDRRPDINARYNMGGWPTTAFLTPDGDPLYGATYLTPGQMIDLLEHISEYYSENKTQIAEKVQQHRANVARQLAASPKVEAALTQEIVTNVAAEVRRNFDSAYGGFGMQPKFPHPDAISLAIVVYAARGNDEMRQVAERTLFGMASGGMYDAYAGGFFRYSTTRDWSVPHFEKMLYDNTRLISTNLLAFQVLGDARFKAIAQDVARFLFDVLYNGETGSFAGSQDADKEEEYYGLSLEDRTKLPTPYIDWTVYLDWNALAVSALIDLYYQSAEEELLVAAMRLYDFLTSRIAPKHYFFDHESDGAENLLTDITALLGASLALFEATGSKRYLDESRGMADSALTELYSEMDRRFRDVPETAGALGNLNVPRFDQEENAHICRHLMRLSTFTQSEHYRRVAEYALASFAGSYAENSYFSAGFAMAVSDLLSPTVHIVIVGDPDSQQTVALKFTAFRTFVNNKTVELRSPEESGEYPPDADGRPIAYVCIDTTCSLPIADSEQLIKLLTRSMPPVF